MAFLAVVLFSGAISGTIQGVANFVLVEPVLDRAIYLENKALFDSGAEQDSIEFRVAQEEYRLWQKGGQLISSTILGMSIGSLFGIIFSYTKKSLPSSDIIKKTLILAAIMWLILFIIPFVKYPSNPPTVGDVDTVNERMALYAGLIAVHQDICRIHMLSCFRNQIRPYFQDKLPYLVLALLAQNLPRPECTRYLIQRPKMPKISSFTTQ